MIAIGLWLAGAGRWITTFVGGILRAIPPMGWVAIAFAVVSGFAWHQTVSLDHARAALRNPATHRTWQSEAETATINLSTCTLNSAGRLAALDAQSAAVAALHADVGRVTTQATRDAQRARLAAVAARRTPAQILAVQPGPDLCASALALIRSH